MSLPAALGGGGVDIVAWSRGMDRGRDHITRKLVTPTPCRSATTIPKMIGWTLVGRPVDDAGMLDAGADAPASPPGGPLARSHGLQREPRRGPRLPVQNIRAGVLIDLLGPAPRFPPDRLPASASRCRPITASAFGLGGLNGSVAASRRW